jgi:hypothetical protein
VQLARREWIPDPSVAALPDWLTGQRLLRDTQATALKARL